MVLNEEHNEQNQQTWLSRIARERQDLSVSVAETLGLSIQEEFSWSDDDEHDYADGYPSAQDAAVVPPRLSLQSRTVETIPSTDGAQAGLKSSAVVSSGEVEVGDSDVPTQNTNILTRFAQRLTASFSALNANLQDNDASIKNQVAQTPPLAFDQKASSLAAIANIEVFTASTMTGALARMPQIPTPASDQALGESAQTRQRLAGRSTRIRLEVVPGPDGKKIMPSFARDIRPPEITEANTTGMRLPIAPAHRSDPGSTSVHLPAMKSSRDAVGSTSAHISAVDARQSPSGSIGTHPELLESQPLPLRGALSGTASFERGQRELTIPNSAITGSSVVLVTLVTNPGPVVVQYISLQPQSGFTVHLTAPTSTSVAFNYAVLSTEH